MFFSKKKKIVNICINILNECLPEYYNLVKTLLSVNKEPSKEEYAEKVYIPFSNLLYNKATAIINESEIKKVIVNWRMASLSNACGYDIDFEHLSLGMIYAMLYYSFLNKPAKPGECMYMNHYAHAAMQKILLQLDGELSND